MIHSNHFSKSQEKVGMDAGCSSGMRVLILRKLSLMHTRPRRAGAGFYAIRIWGFEEVIKWSTGKLKMADMAIAIHDKPFVFDESTSKVAHSPSARR